MALAFLTYEFGEGPFHSFQADIGKNQYFSVMIGESDTYRSYGVNMLAKKSFESHIYGPIPSSKFGRVRFRIPSHLIDRKNRYVQIMSYKDREKNSMAISSIVQTLPSSANDNGPLPTLQFSMESKRINPMIVSTPFQFREGKLSEPFFFKKIMEFLPKVLPEVSKLFNKGEKSSKGTPKKAGFPQKILDLMSDPKRLQDILDLLSGVREVGETNGDNNVGNNEGELSTEKAVSSAFIDPMTIMTVITAATDALAKLGEIGAQINKDELDAIIKLNPGVDDEDVQGLLNQMSIGGLSDAFIDPTMVVQLIGKAADALEKLGKIGAQINKDELDTIIKLNPGVDDKDVQGLLNQMGMKGRSYRKIQFADSAIVRLRPKELVTQRAEKENVYIFEGDRSISIPLEIRSKRDIPKGIVQVLIYRKNSDQVVAEHRMQHNGSQHGILSTTPELPLDQSDNLVPGEVYDASISIIWRGKNEKKYGRSIELPISIAREYDFGRLGKALETIPLNDIDLHRPFWHKVWQSDFDKETVRYEFECKYYYSIEVARNVNAQMQTVEYLTPERPRKMAGKMKSGLIMSTEVLNDLLPSISEYSSLSRVQLETLEQSKYIQTQHKAARTSINYRGKDGEMAVLWVYPEVQLREIHLKRIGNTNAHGNVLSFQEEIVHFPIIHNAHFIGAQSKNEG
ncbi:MAG: hypothetical protein MK066_13410 [Crocinitomicaceae bacterium]|nr:hypothetical protein [Crocinitomicaceae bacterium]